MSSMMNFTIQLYRIIIIIFEIIMMMMRRREKGFLLVFCFDFEPIDDEKEGREAEGRPRAGNKNCLMI